MKDFKKDLKAYVRDHPARFCSKSDLPALDTLYWHYCEDVGIETPESKLANSNFNAALDTLSVDKSNEIYTLALKLSVEETRAAFICGVQLGVQLMLEALEEGKH